MSLARCLRVLSFALMLPFAGSHLAFAQDVRPAFQWSESSIEQLLDVIRRAGEDGLNPDHYHLKELETAGRDAAADALRTKALLRLGSDLYFGHLNPNNYVPEIELVPNRSTPRINETLAAAVNSASIPAAMQQLRPREPIYAALRSALATYGAIAERGGWTTVSAGPTLHPGEQSPRVIELRARLCASNDLRGDQCGGSGETYEGALVEALRHFQGRHLLEADGVVGKRTLAELNAPVTARIDQMRVNLERARWLLHDLPSDYVLVDIAGYELRYMRGGKELLRSRVVVGKPYRETPIFRSAISYIEFAPTWTVPPTILRNDVLPDIRKDPAYLTKKRMRLIDADGREVDPSGVNWSQYKGKRVPPFMIRQDPGPENSLGRVKFMFPNGHYVYLHDTPARELFGRSDRSFSSGCIRVEQAARLTELLLEQQGWDAARVAAAMNESTPRRVDLKTRVPVMLYYWTVALEDDGDILFKRDVYKRDAAVLKGLNET